MTILAIAIILPLGGCNTSQTVSEDSSSETATVQEPETSEDSASLSPWQKPQLLHSLKSDATPMRSIAVSPDNQTLGSSSFGGKIKLWNIQSGQLLLTIDLGTEVTSISFSPDGQTFVTGDADSNVKLWELATGKLLRTFEGHKFVVDSVAFSPDGQTLVSGAWDKTIKLWNIETGKLLQTLEGNKDMVTSVAFSPDGQVIVNGSFDGSIKLWQLNSAASSRSFDDAHFDPVKKV